MTLLPHDSWNVKAAQGPLYKLSPRCANPFCECPADHAHHLWRRSFIGGDVAWVRLAFMESDMVVQNKVGLCFACHDRITRNVAAIEWDDVGAKFVWSEPDWAPSYLDPQPEHLGAAVDSPALDPAGDHGSAEVCPTCKQRKRRLKVELPPGEKRKRKSWTVKVPDDSEDGADVLDTLVEAVAEKWDMQYESALGRYHVLVPALYAVIANDIQIGE